MNLWREIIYSFIRWLVNIVLGGVIAWFVTHGVISAEQGLLVTGAVIVLLTTLLTALYNKFKAKFKLDWARLVEESVTHKEIAEVANTTGPIAIVKIAAKGASE